MVAEEEEEDMEETIVAVMAEVMVEADMEVSV